MQIGVLNEEPLRSLCNCVIDCPAGYSRGDVPINSGEFYRKLLDGRSHRESANQSVTFASEENRPGSASPADQKLRAASDAICLCFSNSTDAYHKPSCPAHRERRAAVTGNYFGPG